MQSTQAYSGTTFTTLTGFRLRSQKTSSQQKSIEEDTLMTYLKSIEEDTLSTYLKTVFLELGSYQNYFHGQVHGHNANSLNTFSK